MRKQNILLVDDNKAFVAALKFIIEDGYADLIENIFIANNGQECLDIINKELIDIVFMDINMPVMDGIEATKLIVDRFRNVKIIAVSFHSEFETIQQMIQAGARNYVIKEEISKDTIGKFLLKQ